MITNNLLNMEVDINTLKISLYLELFVGKLSQNVDKIAAIHLVYFEEYTM